MDCYAPGALEADVGHKNYIRRQLIAESAFNSGVGCSVVPVSVEFSAKRQQ